MGTNPHKSPFPINPTSPVRSNLHFRVVTSRKLFQGILEYFVSRSHQILFRGFLEKQKYENGCSWGPGMWTVGKIYTCDVY